MIARVHVTLKQGVLDPQGKAIANSLKSLGISGISGVLQGKYIEVELEDANSEIARAAVEDMCKRLLANTVIEDYTIELDG